MKYDIKVKVMDEIRGEQKNRFNQENQKKLTEKTKPVKKPIEPVKIFRKMSGLVRFPVLVCLNRPTRTEPVRFKNEKK